MGVGSRSKAIQANIGKDHKEGLMFKKPYIAIKFDGHGTFKSWVLGFIDQVNLRWADKTNNSPMSYGNATCTALLLRKVLLVFPKSQISEAPESKQASRLSLEPHRAA